MKTIILAALVSVVVFGQAVAAGPFGFEQGASPDSYGCVKTNSEGMFTCDAPKPHPAFETYAVQAEQGIGICWVKGIGKDLITSGSGIPLRNKAEEISDQISSTYGKYTESVDKITTGGIWDDFEDWTMASLNAELIYYYEWTLSKDKQVNNVKSIFVSAKATGRNKGFPLAEFSFSNEELCDAAKKKREAGAF